MELRATLTSLLWLGGLAFVLSLILTPIMRDIFRSYGVVDSPDQGRKVHKYPIPRVGGIAIAISYLAAFLLAPAAQGSILQNNVYLIWRLLPALAVIFSTGIIDDLFGLKPWQKLIGQFGAASLAYFAGIRILFVANIPTDHWWSFPATVLMLLVCSNAFNLVDGMDGLAGGIGLFSTLTIFAAALVLHSPALALATLPLAGCLLGFLCYNFNPATIFLGDSGSLTIGFLLGCFGIIWTQKSATLLGMTAPLMALSIPLLDTCLCVVRRLLKRQSIFSPDRGHIHHKLLDLGFTPRRAVLVVYGLCSLVACFSLLQTTVRNDRVGGIIAIVFFVAAWLGIQCLGYAEFTVAGKMLVSGDFQRALKVQLELRNFANEVAHATTAEECWQLLKTSASRCGLNCDQLYIDRDHCFETSRSGVRSQTEFHLRVPILETGHVDLSRPLSNMVSSGVVGPFIDAIHGVLGPQLHKLRTVEAPSSVLERVV